MKKNEVSKSSLPRRVLARALAEDLRRVSSGAGILSCAVTEPNPNPDITNQSGDNDGPIPP